MCHRQNTLWSLGCILFETFYCLPLSSSYKTAHEHWPHINVCRVSCGGVVNMLLVLSITSDFHNNIWGCMCSTCPYQYRWLKGYIYSSCYYQIGSYPIVIIFSRECVFEMFAISYSVTYCIYIRENRESVFTIIVQLMMSANDRIRLVLWFVLVCLYIKPFHYHHYANLSEDIELIKCLWDIFCRVCEWGKAYSLSYPLYNTWGCVFSVYPFPL